jgi:hypothetical protein
MFSLGKLLEDIFTIPIFFGMLVVYITRDDACTVFKLLDGYYSQVKYACTM